MLQALTLYAAHPLDYGDVFIVASMHQAGATELYSYDKGFYRFANISRQEP